MAENDVTIEINVDGEAAKKSLDAFQKQSDKTFKSVEKSASELEDAFKKMAVKIGTAVASFAAIKHAIGEAVAEEKDIRALGLAMAGTGEYSAAAAESMEAFAESLGNVSGFGDDAIRTSLTLAKSFGITNDEAKKLVDAAADLSAVTGDDLETAVRQLGGTLDGSVGKVGLLGADFRNLTEAQLKNGAAIDLLNKRYGDAAETLGQTFGASLSRLQNAFDDSFKEIGKAIIQDAGIKENLDAFAQGLKDLAPAIANFAKLVITGFSMAAEGIAELAKMALMAANAVAETFGQDALAQKIQETALSLDNFSQRLRDSRNGINETDKSAQAFTQTLDKVSAASKKTGELTGKALEDARKKAKELADEGAKFKEGIFSGFGDSAETEAAKAQQALLKSFELEKKGALSSKDAYDIRLRIAEDFNKKRSDAAEKSAKEESDKIKKIADETRAEIEKIASNPIMFFFDTNEKDFKGAGAALAGAFDKALSGRSGAVQLFSSIGGKLADEILPGIGGVVGSIISKLAAGKEQAKAFVKEFIDSIPDIIIAIIDALPEALSGIIEKIFSPEFLARLGLAIGKSMVFIFTAGISAYAGEWGRKLAEGFQEYILPAFEKAASYFTAVFRPLLNAISYFVDSIKAVFEPMISALNALREAIDRASGKDLANGKIGGMSGKRLGVAVATGGLSEAPVVGPPIRKAVGLAKGGVVPMYAADGAFVPRGTDTVPAMLTPGELVIPRDMVGELGAFLAAQNGGGGTSDAATLAAILSAVQAPIVVKTEAKVNQNAFADIILQLNRQNARLAV